MSRWPVIRHLRYFYYRVQIARWYGFWATMGMHDGNRIHDEKVLDRIWRGQE